MTRTSDHRDHSCRKVVQKKGSKWVSLGGAFAFGTAMAQREECHAASENDSHSARNAILAKASNESKLSQTYPHAAGCWLILQSVDLNNRIFYDYPQQLRRVSS